MHAAPLANVIDGRNVVVINIVVINISGRGDKDLQSVARFLGEPGV